MPAVTVAIPAYKPRYLAEAIESVLRQDFRNFELLISDDRGDGSIRKVVSRFKDPRIKLLRGPRRGLVANSAFLWNNASADFLKFLYDDDLLHPSAIRELGLQIEKRADFAYSFCNRVLIDAEGRVVDKPSAFPGEGSMWFEPQLIPTFMMQRIFNKVGEPSNILIRRSAFKSAECLTHFAGFPINHLIDVAFYMNAGLVGACIGTPKHLASFRIHQDQVSSRTRAPAFSAGIFEWEVFLRGSVQLGLVQPADALQGLVVLESLYRRHEGRFEELGLLKRGLPSLQDSLAAGVTAVITPQFRDDFATAQRLISQRTVELAAAP